MLSERAETQRQAYRRGVFRACGLSIAVHLVLFLCLNPWPLLGLFGPNVPIGFPGRGRHGELAPEGEPWQKRVSLVQPYALRGPVNLVNIGPTGITEHPDITDKSDGSTVGDYAPGARIHGRAGNPKPGEPGGGILVELDEHWATVRGSSSVAHSKKLQIVKAVRPEYPPSAIHDGIEGLVTLEVSIDSLGAVIDVRTRQDTAGNRDLETAAVRAMYKWEFKPYLVNSRAVPITVRVPFRYRLVG
jgi:TonB family protein